LARVSSLPRTKVLKKVGMLELLKNVVHHLLLAQPFGASASLGANGGINRLGVEARNSSVISATRNLHTRYQD